jgi:hypothetical protein
MHPNDLQEFLDNPESRVAGFLRPWQMTGLRLNSMQRPKRA